MTLIRPLLADVGLLVLRLGVGLSFTVAHGWGKMLGGPEQWSGLGKAIGALGVPVFVPIFWGFMAMLAELVGGLLLAVGFATRIASFFLLCTMAVATAMHITAGDPAVKFSRPIEMGFVFLGLMLIGPGRFAIDHWIRRRRELRSATVAA